MSDSGSEVSNSVEWLVRCGLRLSGEVPLRRCRVSSSISGLGGRCANLCRYFSSRVANVCLYVRVLFPPVLSLNSAPFSSVMSFGVLLCVHIWQEASIVGLSMQRNKRYLNCPPERASKLARGKKQARLF